MILLFDHCCLEKTKEEKKFLLCLWLIQVEILIEVIVPFTF